MTGFADRFSDTQQAALQALGYRLLEQGTLAAPQADVSGPAADAAMEHPADAHQGRQRQDRQAHPGQWAPVGKVSADRSASANRRLPSVILVEDITGDNALLQGILAALEPFAMAHPGRVSRTAGSLRIELGGSGDAWRVGIDELRASPRHKAALWRGLRRLRTEPAR
jgi:hypothetical protein